MIDKTPQQCPKCQRTFIGNYARAIHHRSCHYGELPPCPLCKSLSTKKNGLEAGKQRYQCLTCKKRYIQETIIYTNCVVCRQPLGDKPFHQKYCSRPCNSKAFYKRHKERIDEWRADYFKKNWLKYKEKANIRSLTRYYNPSLEGKVCVICGSTDKLQRHHPDIINQPKLITILCEPCHQLYTKHEQEQKKKQSLEPKTI